MNRANYDVDVIGDRVIAQFIDGVLVVVLAFVLLFGGMGVIGVGQQGGGASGAFGSIGVVAFFAAFFVGVVYNVGLEHHWNGQTLGKRALGIRVVSVDGSDASLGQVVVRNVLAVINLGLFSVIAALISMATNEKNQRIFDAIASTVVVEHGTASGGVESTRSNNATQSRQF